MIELIQAALQTAAAGKSSLSVVLDAGTIGLILTNSGLLIKALVDRKTIKAALDTAAIAVKREKDADPVGVPGEGKTCREHGESISALEESKKNTSAWLARIDGKVDELLKRKGQG
jgi:hypothetical protein